MPIPTYFKFNGIDSRDFGIVVTNYPPVIIPAERTNLVEVIGRSGSLTKLEGPDVYKTISMAVDCYIEDLGRLDELAAWLRGRGDLILGSDPTKCYRARIANQIDMTKVVRGNETRVFSVIFSCDPFRYEAEPTSRVLYESFNLANPSQISADPLIITYGMGDVTVHVGRVSVSLSGLSGSVTIDCEAKVAYTDMGSNVAISLDNEAWPSLEAGRNLLAWSGSVSKVVVRPNWRWL